MYTGCQHIFFKSGEKTPQPVNTLVHMALNSLFGSFPSFIIVLSSLVAQRVKNLPALQETWVRFFVQDDPLEKEIATHSIFLPGEIHGQRCLVGY